MNQRPAYGGLAHSRRACSSQDACEPPAAASASSGAVRFSCAGMTAWLPPGRNTAAGPIRFEATSALILLPHSGASPSNTRAPPRGARSVNIFRSAAIACAASADTPADSSSGRSSPSIVSCSRPRGHLHLLHGQHPERAEGLVRPGEHRQPDLRVQPALPGHHDPGNQVGGAVSLPERDRAAGNSRSNFCW